MVRAVYDFLFQDTLISECLGTNTIALECDLRFMTVGMKKTHKLTGGRSLWTMKRKYLRKVSG